MVKSEVVALVHSKRIVGGASGACYGSPCHMLAQELVRVILAESVAVNVLVLVIVLLSYFEALE